MSQTPPQIALSSRAQSNTFVSQGVWTFALRADPPQKTALPGICPSLGRIQQPENSVTATEVLVWRPLLGDRGRIKKQSSVGIPVFVGRLERKLFQLTTESSGRPQQLQRCRQSVPCSRCGDRESPVADSSTCRRQYNRIFLHKHKLYHE